VIAAALSAIDVTRSGRALVVRFAAEERVCSWAIAGGGMRSARSVVWIEVRDEELRPPVDARAFLAARLAEHGAADGVGMLTSRSLDAWVDVTRAHGDVSARCIATAGLGNALRAGDLPGVAGRIGTINLLCRVDVALSDEALLEAMAIATEARTAAVIDARIPSRRSGAIATGTGTDCVVVACPQGAGEAYAGKHTRVGHVIGAAVYDAIAEATAQWQREQQLRGAS